MDCNSRKVGVCVRHGRGRGAVSNLRRHALDLRLGGCRSRAGRSGWFVATLRFLVALPPGAGAVLLLLLLLEVVSGATGKHCNNESGVAVSSFWVAGRTCGWVVVVVSCGGSGFAAVDISCVTAVTSVVGGVVIAVVVGTGGESNKQGVVATTGEYDAEFVPPFPTNGREKGVS